MYTLILDWRGEIAPTYFMADMADTLHSACVTLARNGTQGAKVDLPLRYLSLLDRGEVTHREQVLWKLEFVSTEGALVGIMGCVFELSTHFKGNPLNTRFLISHRDLRVATKQAEAEA